MTDKADPSCALTITSNGESGIYAGSFEGDLVKPTLADFPSGRERHKVSVMWSVRP